MNNWLFCTHYEAEPRDSFKAEPNFTCYLDKQTNGLLRSPGCKGYKSTTKLVQKTSLKSQRPTHRICNQMPIEIIPQTPKTHIKSQQKIQYLCTQSQKTLPMKSTQIRRQMPIAGVLPYEPVKLQQNPYGLAVRKQNFPQKVTINYMNSPAANISNPESIANSYLFGPFMSPLSNSGLKKQHLSQEMTKFSLQKEQSTLIQSPNIGSPLKPWLAKSVDYCLVNKQYPGTTLMRSQSQNLNEIQCVKAESLADENEEMSDQFSIVLDRDNQDEGFQFRNEADEEGKENGEEEVSTPETVASEKYFFGAQ